MQKAKVILWFLFFLWLTACQKDDPSPTNDQPDNALYSGGENGTTFDFGENAYGVQIKGLSNDQEGYFVTGNAFFRSNWVTAPASVQSLDGLGPVFNAVSCGSCHFKDGRAKPPLSPDEALNGLLFRLSIPGAGPNGGPLGDPVYGGQFQDKSILSVEREGGVRVSYEAISGQYPDGTEYVLHRPMYEFYNLSYGSFTSGLQYSPRIAPQIPGLGLLEAIPEMDILARADENDVDQDGISGKANYVWDVEQQSTKLGRFGWKCNQPSLRQQTAGAFNGDIGITSSIFPADHLTQTQAALYPGLANGGSPEISDETLNKVIVYVQALSVPARRNFTDPLVQQGKSVFDQIGCENCHRATFQTGTTAELEGLENQLIYPYTDLLLHDMGPELADNRPDYLADGREWRTPPLWGIGLVQTVNNHSRFLHDGRAHSLEEAVLWHGGEAAKSLEQFKALNKTDREAVLAFLQSL